MAVRRSVVMDTGGLNDYSRRFAEYLFSAFPQWEPLAGVDEAKGVTPVVLLVEVPAPVPSADGVDRGLLISTHKDEITVRFDRHHSHSGWSDRPDEEAFAGAVGFIEDVLEQRVKLVVSMNGNEWVCSNIIGVREGPEILAGQRTCVRSWAGKFDAEYHA